MGDYLQATLLGMGRIIFSSNGGNQHACAILDNFNVTCWGYNLYGQLGYGDNTIRENLANQMGDYLTYVNMGSGVVARSI